MTVPFKTSLLREAYFENMNSSDLKARGVSTPEEAFLRFARTARPPLASELAVIRASTYSADQVVAPYRALAVIPWDIIVVDDNIESGFPHTHHESIVLPKAHITSKDLTHTLIHEKVHVFQRLHPCKCNMLYLCYWGFTIANRRQVQDGLRSNPDTNLLIYKDERGVPIQLYYKNNEKPFIGATTGDSRDHPHEMMAYIVTYIATRGESYLAPNLERYVSMTKQWMLNHL